jgi:hypothetical protein
MKFVNLRFLKCFEADYFDWIDIGLWPNFTKITLAVSIRDCTYG